MKNPQEQILTELQKIQEMCFDMPFEERRNTIREINDICGIKAEDMEMPEEHDWYWYALLVETLKANSREQKDFESSKSKTGKCKKIS